MIPTAEEFLFSLNYSKDSELQFDEITKVMIEFAKLHVTEALKEAEASIYIKAVCGICCNGDEITFSENPIKNCYPLHRIE